MAEIVQLDKASRWYGDVIALNNVSLTLEPGVVGLVGPNGAGKTTMLRLITGQIRATSGHVTVFGENIWKAVDGRSRLGYCPEHDQFYENMTGLKFVTLMTQLYGYSANDAQDRAIRALGRVNMDESSFRSKPISNYSKGMRQKVKIAQAIAHEPELLVLDEPFTGVDALSRHHIAGVLRDFGTEGRSVILSSHVLHEVEQVTGEFILIDRGRLVAHGNIYEIRELIDEHPHRIEVHCSNPRRLAASLVQQSEAPIGFQVESDRKLVIQTATPNACYELLPKVSLDLGVTLFRVTSPDNNLEAVFRYLTREA